jgi:hypothetical protein
MITTILTGNLENGIATLFVSVVEDKTNIVKVKVYHNSGVIDEVNPNSKYFKKIYKDLKLVS